MDPQQLWHLQELLRRVGWLAEHQLKMDGLLQSMESRLAVLEGQLRAVESSLQALDQRLSDLEERPSTRIDKIEYKFEQLKVDTLSGSLQIGLAHGAEGMIEELGAGSKSLQDVKLSPSESGEPYAPVIGRLNEYLDSGLYRDIDEAAARSGSGIDPELRETIGRDLAKQLRERAVVYMKEIPEKEGRDEAAVDAILGRLQSDVRSGLDLFFGAKGKETAS